MASMLTAKDNEVVRTRMGDQLQQLDAGRAVGPQGLPDGRETVGFAGHARLRRRGWTRRMTPAYGT